MPRPINIESVVEIKVGHDFNNPTITTIIKDFSIITLVISSIEAFRLYKIVNVILITIKIENKIISPFMILFIPSKIKLPKLVINAVNNYTPPYFLPFNLSCSALAFSIPLFALLFADSISA